MSADTTPGMEAEQDAFELAFPMPANCLRFPGGYAPTEFNAWDASKFCERWEGWKAARRAPALAPQGPSMDDLTELVRSLGHNTWRQSAEIASAVLARWGAPAASGEPVAEEHEQAPAYRLLERSDRIAQDDEFLDDDATTWAKDAGGIFVGMRYAPGVLRPGRRAVKP